MKERAIEVYPSHMVFSLVRLDGLQFLVWGPFLFEEPIASEASEASIMHDCNLRSERPACFLSISITVSFQKLIHQVLEVYEHR